MQSHPCSEVNPESCGITLVSFSSRLSIGNYPFCCRAGCPCPMSVLTNARAKWFVTRFGLPLASTSGRPLYHPHSPTTRHLLCFATIKPGSSTSRSTSCCQLIITLFFGNDFIFVLGRSFCRPVAAHATLRIRFLHYVNNYFLERVWWTWNKFQSCFCRPIYITYWPDRQN